MIRLNNWLVRSNIMMIIDKMKEKIISKKEIKMNNLEI